MLFRTILLICWLVSVQGTNSKKMDLIFLLDGSGSVGKANFEIIKNLIKECAENLDLNGPVNLGVVEYSYRDSRLDISHQRYIKTEIQLGQHKNIKDFKAAVDKIPLYGYQTYTGYAINKTVLDFKSSERFSDNETSKIMILITDGRATDRSYIAASSAYARRNHIEIYSVGVGRADITELQIIANGQPGNNERVYHASDYSDLRSTIFKKVTAEIDSKSGTDTTDNCFNETTSQKIDLIFLIDGSGSVGKENFSIMKKSIKYFVENVDLNGPVKLGIVQYSHWGSRFSIAEQPYIKTEIKLGQHTNISEFRAAVDKIRLHGYTTYTAHAIEKTILDFESSERFVDSTTSKIMILITDGRASDASEISTSATEARRNHIKIYAVGIGDVVERELQIIANGETGNNERVYLLSDFSSLPNILEGIKKKVCPSVPTVDTKDVTSTDE